MLLRLPPLPSSPEKPRVKVTTLSGRSPTMLTPTLCTSLRKPLGRAEHFQNVLIVNAADHLGESYKAVTIDINGVAAYAVIARQAADRLVQQHIKSRALGRWVLEVRSCPTPFASLFSELSVSYVWWAHHRPNISSAVIIPHSENARFSFLLCILSIFAVFAGLSIVFVQCDRKQNTVFVRFEKQIVTFVSLLWINGA